MKNFLQVMKARRSYYGLEKCTTVSDETIIELVQEAVLYTPSAFNMQSSRTVVLFGADHTQLWKIALESLRPLISMEEFPATEEKISSFSAGYGTILYFDDTEVTEAYAQQYSLYKDNFPIWSQQSNGMLQFAIWNLLEEAGLGASLQHYNPLIDESVRNTWSLPASWKLIAQMPFGTPSSKPDPKEFVSIEKRVKVFGL
jgi:predicted oxidoreductase (fatty acid repression mutant protein)